MGKRETIRATIRQQQEVQRMRHDRLYGPVDERTLRWLRLPNLHPELRLRLLHTVFEGGLVSYKDRHRWWIPTIGGRRFFYAIWSWRGRWTWGIGFDREGVGLYLGPWSGWLVWRGR
jgi:hypothetical protein